MNGNLKLNQRDRAMLMQAPFLAGLGNQAMVRLLSVMTITTLPSRRFILRDGEPADAFFCVLGGYVRLFRLSREGKEADLMVCSPGETFAECQLFGDGCYHYNAQTAEPTTLARFDMQAVRDLMREEPEIAGALVASISRHLQKTMDCIANDRLFTAPQRVANYILSSCPVDGGPASIRLPFQKSLLAGMLGLAPEALSRAFSSLRKVGVTVRGRVIQVEDVRALKDI